MLQHEGDNPAERDAAADRPGRQNLGAAKRLRSDWLSGRADPAATARLLDVLRTGNGERCVRPWSSN